MWSAAIACLFAAASADVLLDGGASGWDEGQWRVQVDGVMGGKSTGNLQFQDGALVFSGTISLDGGGFSSVRRSLPNQDLSGFAGLVVELEAEAYSSGKAPLGLHLQLNDRSMWGYSASFAVPFAEAAGTTTSVFLPMSSFDRASWMGSTCASCRLNAQAVNGMDIYALFQEGPFEARLRSITAVQGVPSQAFATPVVPLSSAASVKGLLTATIQSGGSLYDKGYKGLCIAVYASSLRTVLASSGPSEPTKGVACAGLASAGQGSKTDRAWRLRDTMDAILADLDGVGRGSRQEWLPDGGAAASTLDTCMGLLASGEGSATIDTMMEGSSSSGAGAGASPAEVEGFEGPFRGMGISGHNDLQSSVARDPAECAARCSADARCRSFDWGARQAVTGECWLSTADRGSVGSAYTSWPLYDYYERIMEASMDQQMSAESREDPPDNQMSGEGTPDNQMSGEDPTTTTFVSAAFRAPAGLAVAVAGWSLLQLVLAAAPL